MMDTLEVHSILEGTANPSPLGHAVAVGQDMTRVVCALARAAQTACADDGVETRVDAVAVIASRALGARGCSVYLRDRDGGDLVVVSGDASVGDGGADRWRGPMAISRRTPGLERVLSEGAVAEIPLPPATNGVPMPAIHLRPAIVVPVTIDGKVDGVMVFGADDAETEVRHAVRSYGGAFATIAGSIVAQAQRSAVVERKRRASVARLRAQVRAARVEDELFELALTCDGANELIEFLARDLGLPCALLTGRDEVIACEGEGAATRSCLWEEGLTPAVWDELSSVESGAPRLLGPLPRQGIHHRHLLARVPDTVGRTLLVIAEVSRGFTAADLHIARRAASVVAFRLESERRFAETETRLVESVLRDALYGSDDVAALRARARRARIDLDAVSVVGVISSRSLEPSSGRDHSLLIAQLRSLAGRLELSHLTQIVGIRAGAAMIAPASHSGPAAGVVHAELERLLDVWPVADDHQVATVSSVCRKADELPRAFQECHDVRRALVGLGADDARVFCSDELGPGRLLLGGADVTTGTRLGQEIFGTIEHESERAKALETLDAYFANNHAIRTAARSLGVHENTVRYRLRKFASLTGLDVVRSGDDQLTARLALTAVKLRSNATKKEAQT